MQIVTIGHWPENKTVNRRGSRQFLCMVLSLETSDRNWLKRRARDILHVERSRSCHFADSAGVWHGAQQLERLTGSEKLARR